MTLHEFNLLPPGQLKKELFNCCGSTEWVNKMLQFFPMEDLVELLEDAEEEWFTCTENDWREAFSQHPKFGDIADKNFVDTIGFATAAKQLATSGLPNIITELAAANKNYEEKFGYNFIVCATGKSATEMLGLLQDRLKNTPAVEIKIAMDEQNKITLLRLQKLLQ